MDYVLHILIVASIYIMLAHSLSFIVAYSGQISLAHAGFFGIGAYSIVFLQQYIGLPPNLFSVALVVLFSSGISFGVHTLVRDNVDDYFIIVTLALNAVVFSIFNNAQEWTGGPLGLGGIQPLTIFGYALATKSVTFWAYIGISAGVWYIIYRITNSGVGRLLLSIKDDEVFSTSLGKNVNSAKCKAFVLSCSLASMAGALYAQYVGYIDPSSFELSESILVLAIVILGGMRNLLGITLAALFLVIMPELLRQFNVSTAIAFNFKQALYGFGIVVAIYIKLKKQNRSISDALEAHRATKA